MADKLLAFLGIAKRANALAMGHDLSMDMVKSGKAKLVMIAADASERLEREFLRAAEGCPVIRINKSINDIGLALPKAVGVIAVEGNGFANRLIELIEED